MDEQQKPKRKGGRRNPPGGRPTKPIEEQRKPIQVSFTPQDLEMLAALIADEYGKSRTDVLRRALREAFEDRAANLKFSKTH